jgi:serine/threonine protein kinase
MSRFEDIGATATPSFGGSYYTSPEVAGQNDVTTKVDVFAFGVILNEIMCGGNVFSEAIAYPLRNIDPLPEVEHVSPTADVNVEGFYVCSVDEPDIFSLVFVSTDHLPEGEDAVVLPTAGMIIGECCMCDVDERPTNGHVSMNTDHLPVVKDVAMSPTARMIIERCCMCDVDERPTFDDVLRMLNEMKFGIYEDVDADAVRRFIEEIASAEGKCE